MVLHDANKFQVLASWVLVCWQMFQMWWHAPTRKAFTAMQGEQPVILLTGVHQWLVRHNSCRMRLSLIQKYSVVWPTVSSSPYLGQISTVEIFLKCFPARAIHKPSWWIMFRLTMVLTLVTQAPGAWFLFSLVVLKMGRSTINSCRSSSRCGLTSAPAVRLVRLI